MRIVIKVGTSTLAHPSGRMNIRRTRALCRVLSDIKNMGNDVILVTSGAIGMGMGKLSLQARPADIATKQAVAAIGQCDLMYTYDKFFSEYHHTIAQLLLTAEDFDMICGGDVQVFHFLILLTVILYVNDYSLLISLISSAAATPA